MSQPGLHCCGFIIVIGLLVSAAAPARDAEPPGTTVPVAAQGVRADPAYQHQLEQMGRIMRADPVGFYRQALALRDLGKRSPRSADAASGQKLVEQLLLFRSSANSDQMPVSRHEVIDSVVRLLGIEKRQLVNVAATLLDSPEPSVRATAVRVLGGYDHADDLVTDITPLIVQAQKSPERPRYRLLDLMYRQNPTRTFIAMGNIYQLTREESRTFALDQHRVSSAAFKHDWQANEPGEVDAAAATLVRLARDPRWWVKKYAAEMAWRHEVLRSDDLLQLLRSDPDPYIRDVIDRPKPWIITEDGQ